MSGFISLHFIYLFLFLSSVSLGQAESAKPVLFETYLEKYLASQSGKSRFTKDEISNLRIRLSSEITNLNAENYSARSGQTQGLLTMATLIAAKYPQFKGNLPLADLWMQFLKFPRDAQATFNEQEILKRARGDGNPEDLIEIINLYKSALPSNLKGLDSAYLDLMICDSYSRLFLTKKFNKCIEKISPSKSQAPGDSTLFLEKLYTLQLEAYSRTNDMINLNRIITLINSSSFPSLKSLKEKLPYYEALVIFTKNGGQDPKAFDNFLASSTKKTPLAEVQVHHLRAEALITQKKYDDALTEVDTAIDLSIQHAQDISVRTSGSLFTTKSIVFYLKNNIQEALKISSTTRAKILAHRSGFAGAYSILADALLHELDPKDDTKLKATNMQFFKKMEAQQKKLGVDDVTSKTLTEIGLLISKNSLTKGDVEALKKLETQLFSTNRKSTTIFYLLKDYIKKVTTATKSK